MPASYPLSLTAEESTFSHVDLVGVLFVLWGIVTMLIGASTLALGIAAIALATSVATGVGASLTAIAFTTLAILALVWGGLHLFVGTVLKRRRIWCRHLALMLAIVDLLLLPYGTALGVYAIGTLLREDAKRLFEV